MVCPRMTSGHPDPRVTGIVRYIQDHLEEPLPVSTLARMANLSESRLRVLFVAQTGLGPGQYVRRLRLRRGRALIERTFLSVKEVMGLVGYKDARQFARDFRREHGAPPSEMGAAGNRRPGSPSLNPPDTGGSAQHPSAIRDGSTPNVEWRAMGARRDDEPSPNHPRDPTIRANDAPHAGGRRTVRESRRV
jgi:AraC-like DNA-binding protein